MARIARVICPGIPHHVTQRGNRRQQTFFCDEDYRAYIELMAEWCRKHDVAIWAWCLMPNHVHLIAVPQNVILLQQSGVRVKPLFFFSTTPVHTEKETSSRW